MLITEIEKMSCGNCGEHALHWDYGAQDALCSECCEWQRVTVYVTTGKVCYFVSSFIERNEQPDYLLVLRNDSVYNSYSNGVAISIDKPVTPTSIGDEVAAGNLRMVVAQTVPFDLRYQRSPGTLVVNNDFSPWTRDMDVDAEK